MMKPIPTKGRLTSMKCAKCGLKVDCGGLSPGAIETLVYEKIEWCHDNVGSVLSSGEKSNKCGLEMHMDFYDRYLRDNYQAPDPRVSRILQSVPKPTETAFPWPHAKMTQKEANEAEFVEEIKDYIHSVIEEKNVRILGRDGDNVELEIPDPIRILVNKKGVISVIESE